VDEYPFIVTDTPSCRVAVHSAAHAARLRTNPNTFDAAHQISTSHSRDRRINRTIQQSISSQCVLPVSTMASRPSRTTRGKRYAPRAPLPNSFLSYFSRHATADHRSRVHRFRNRIGFLIDRKVSSTFSFS
jgi:hypothetical protein